MTILHCPSKVWRRNLLFRFLTWVPVIGGSWTNLRLGASCLLLASFVVGSDLPHKTDKPKTDANSNFENEKGIKNIFSSSKVTCAWTCKFFNHFWSFLKKHVQVHIIFDNEEMFLIFFLIFEIGVYQFGVRGLIQPWGWPEVDKRCPWPQVGLWSANYGSSCWRSEE